MTDKTPHIHIVDDNPENIRVLGAALAPYKYQITVATNGEIALKAVEEHIPDLMLLDVMMPEIDGFEVCRRLKANPKTKAIEIIFVSAAVSPSDELKGISLGAVDYIHKPFSIPVVQAKVALHLERVQRKRELELKNAALEELAKLRDDIEMMMRQDLKSPLNTLLFYSQMMLGDKDLTIKSRLSLEAMLTAGIEILNKINNSLDLFKMESGRYSFSPRTVDIVAIIKRIINNLQALVEQKKITLNIQVEKTSVKEEQYFHILAEENLCYSLFANLISDAIEACDINGMIVIAMHHENNEGVIAITNTGTVSEPQRTTFFDRPVTDKAENTERGIFEDYLPAKKGRGTWQYAYSAKLMTTTQNGTIAMTSNNQQTCITIRLPSSND